LLSLPVTEQADPLQNRQVLNPNPAATHAATTAP